MAVINFKKCSLKTPVFELTRYVDKKVDMYDVGIISDQNKGNIHMKYKHRR